jgi:hypothetical protein
MSTITGDPPKSAWRQETAVSAWRDRLRAWSQTVLAPRRQE